MKSEGAKQMTEADTAAMQTAFERHFDTTWDDPSMRNERLCWIAAWKASRLAH